MSKPDVNGSRLNKSVDIGRLIKGTTRHVLKNKDAAIGVLFVEWKDIVGPTFASILSPTKITTRKGDITLHLSTPHSTTAFMFHYEQEKLLDRITLYFGTSLVSHIRLHHIPPSPLTENKRNSAKTLPPEWQEDISKIKDPSLSHALTALASHLA